MTKQESLKKLKKLKILTSDLSPEGWKLITAEMNTYDQDFMREYVDQIQWQFLSVGNRLSESFIREISDYVDWEQICTWTHLDEQFIREWKDKVKWLQISRWQKLSKKFIWEFRDKLNIQMLSNNNYIDNNIINQLCN